MDRKDINRYEFELRITRERYLDYYRGAVRHVVVRCTSGQTVRFPASLLQCFVTQEGIHGLFVLTYDEQHKHAALQRVQAPEQPAVRSDQNSGATR